MEEKQEKLIAKMREVIIESGCTYGEVEDVLIGLKNHFAIKAKSLVNAANIHEVNKFRGIKQYDD